jgi:dephospho-CoA kinase
MSISREEGQVPQGSLPLLLSQGLVLPKLAVTGGIASGKSTVVSFLEEMGLVSINADQVARQLREDANTMAELADLLAVGRPLTTEMLREALKHQDKRRIVNHFFHSRVWEALKGSSAQVVEVPLLVESCLWPFFQNVWTVSCPPEIRLKRLTERLGERNSAEKMLEIQAQESTRAALSDLVLNSNVSFAELKFQVKQGFTLLPHGIARENRL